MTHALDFVLVVSVEDEYKHLLGGGCFLMERFSDFPGGVVQVDMTVSIKSLPRRTIDGTCKDFNLKGFL